MLFRRKILYITAHDLHIPYVLCELSKPIKISSIIASSQYAWVTCLSTCVVRGSVSHDILHPASANETISISEAHKCYKLPLDPSTTNELGHHIHTYMYMRHIPAPSTCHRDRSKLSSLNKTTFIISTSHCVTNNLKAATIPRACCHYDVHVAPAFVSFFFYLSGKCN